MKRLCDEIDHLVLLPLESDRVTVVEDGEPYRSASTGSRAICFRGVIVRCCRFLNTTVEMLAKLLTIRLKVASGTEAPKPFTAIEMEVEENFGQTAVYRETLT